jgi:hypothetical protein
MIYNQDRGSVGPGVAVGNGWILTAGMIVEDSVSDSTNINFRFSFDETPEVAASIPVIEVRRLGESLEDPALLRIAEHDIRANPPLKIWSGSLDSAVGRVVMAVGYPEVSEKAIMPGRITRRSDVSGDDAQLFGDLNTARGVGGGPIVDLLTGDIVAVHLGGSMEPGAGRVTFHKALTGWQQRIEAKISQSSDPRQTGDRD